MITQTCLTHFVQRKIKDLFHLLGSEITITGVWPKEESQSLYDYKETGHLVLFIPTSFIPDIIESNDRLHSATGENISGLVFYENNFNIPTPYCGAVIFNDNIYQLTSLEKEYWGTELVILKFKGTR